MNIYSIAKEAGVSTATVSRYINQSGYVGKATAERLRRIIAREGFSPSVAAKLLSTGAPFKLVGLVCYNIDDMYYAKAVSVLEKECKAGGYDIILSCTGKSAAEKERCIAMLLGKNVDAIIFIGSVFMDKSGKLIRDAAKRVPCFIINAELSGKNIYCAYCDDRESVRSAARLLPASGCTSPLFLYDVETYGSQKKRLGFLDAVPDGKTALVPEHFDGIIAALPRLFAAHRPDAVVCSNDVIAAAVLHYAKQQGIAVPAALKVIGHNNSLLAKCVSPALTSIDNRVEALSALTAQNIIALFSGTPVQSPVKAEPILKRRETF